MNPSCPSPALRLIRAAAVVLPDGTCHRPGAVLLDGDRLVWVGSPGDLPSETGPAAVIDLPDRLLLPGMVNAHAHLELTTLGPRPYPGNFMGWVAQLLRDRPSDAEACRESVRQGIEMLKGSGVTAVGDIGGAAGWGPLCESGLAGVAYHEVLGYDNQRGRAEVAVLRRRLTEATRCGLMRLGVQPHAPYTTSRGIYQACVDAAAEQGVPLCTHLAELTEEARFVAEAGGPFREHFERIGYWDPAVLADYTAGHSPVRWMRPHLERARWLVAHCNYVSDEDIRILADTGTSVAYCPIASDYFGHRGHRYRDMLAAGVNVCLGTDSIVCQPHREAPPEAEAQAVAQPLGILAQMRHLYRRDGTDPKLLLRMATTNGRRALALPESDPSFFMVRIDPADGVDPLRQVLASREPVEPVAYAAPTGFHTNTLDPTPEASS